MSRCYFELRPKPLDQTTYVAADMMRHLQTRQYLGKVLVICQSPFPTMRVARKQWLKLARAYQRQRSSTINADKILRFTYTISHMQHLQFTSKLATQKPDAQVFFATSEEAQVPLHCYTVYITHEMTEEQLTGMFSNLPRTALVVDYTGSAPLPANLLPKRELEVQATKKWQEVINFLHDQHIDIKDLATSQFVEIDAMDIALDSLLGVSHEFLDVAGAFQHALELSNPQRIPKTTLQCYNTMTLLAYRVQALTPGASSGHILRTYQEDETYFLHEIISELSPEGETMEETIAGHYVAGRIALATALEQVLKDPRFAEYSSYAVETRERLKQLK